MSRKSLPKKEPVLWYLCNGCNCNVFAKDREQHSCSEQSIGDVLPIQNCTFVCNRKLLTNLLSEKPMTDDLKGINPNKFNNLIFLHESIFPLCDLVLGDNVLVSSSSLAQNAPIVRIAWPMSSSNQSVVCVSKEGNQSLFYFKQIHSSYHFESSEIFSFRKFQNFTPHGNQCTT